MAPSCCFPELELLGASNTGDTGQSGWKSQNRLVGNDLPEGSIKVIQGYRMS